MRIVLDTREAALLEKCQGLVAGTNIQLSHRVLNLGDIAFENDDGTLISILERKSLSDLLASIKDGRYEEQSHRLTHNGVVSLHNIVYIIEGLLSSLRAPQERKIVFSSMASLQYFKGFSVMRTSSIAETAELIVSMADKIERNIQKGMVVHTTQVSTVETSQNYSTVVRSVKKDNITPDNIGAIMLCQIPGISSTMASAILSHFRSFAHLMEEIKNNPTCLDNLTYEHKGKSRKINQTCLANVRLFLAAGGLPSLDASHLSVA